MVAIKAVLASNSTLNLKNQVAVFLGATHGIGLATLKSYLTHSTNPTILIIGRPSSLVPLETSLPLLNPTATLHFLPAPDLTLISSLPPLLSTISSHLAPSQQIDILFQSQGSMSLTGPRIPTPENLEPSLVLRYYSRLYILTSLLTSHLLSPTATIISVLAGGGKEGKILEDDLDLRKEGNWGLGRSMDQFATMMTLSLDELVREGMRGYHVFPGLVDTGYLGRAAGEGWLGWVFRGCIEPVLRRFVMVKPEDVGERMVGYIGGRGYEGKGMWTLDEYGEEKVNKVLKGYRERRFGERVMEHNERMFEEALNTVA